MHNTTSMVSGRYQIEKKGRDGMPKPEVLVSRVTDSLNRSGLQFSITETDSRVVIVAHGAPVHRKRSVPKLSVSAPPPPSVKRCQENLALAWNHYEHLVSRFKASTERETVDAEEIATYLRSRKRRRVIGRLVARSKANPRPNIYADADLIFGHRVKRYSQLSENERSRFDTYADYLIQQSKWQRIPYQFTPHAEYRSTIRQITEAKIDVEYWQEMIRLQTEKPEGN